MFTIYKKTKLRRYPGAISGLLCVFYGVFRIFCEQFRQPDIQIGFLTSWGLTMGQLLSGIMVLIGITVFIIAVQKRKMSA